MVSTNTPTCHDCPCALQTAPASLALPDPIGFARPMSAQPPLPLLHLTVPSAVRAVEVVGTLEAVTQRHNFPAIQLEGDTVPPAVWGHALVPDKLMDEN